MIFGDFAQKDNIWDSWGNSFAAHIFYQILLLFFYQCEYFFRKCWIHDFTFCRKCILIECHKYNIFERRPLYYGLCTKIIADINFIQTHTSDSGFILNLNIELYCGYLTLMICKIWFHDLFYLWITTLILFIVEVIIPLLIERKSFSGILIAVCCA